MRTTFPTLSILSILDLLPLYTRYLRTHDDDKRTTYTILMASEVDTVCTMYSMCCDHRKYHWQLAGPQGGNARYDAFLD